MIGELLREAALLVGVFAPLDLIVAGKPLTMEVVALIMALASVLAAVGITIEVIRR
jgi:hypothetical protein